MTAAKLDPALCRRLAGRCADATRNLDEVRGPLQKQLVAAADLAEKHECDTADLHRDLCAERNAMRAHLAERTLTEERVREVVRKMIHLSVGGPIGDLGTARIDAAMVDAIAALAAKELAGAVVK